MNKTILLILTILTFVSCDNSKTTTEDWGDGRKVVNEYSDYQDTSTYLRKFYYPNGQLGTKGEYVNGEMHGVWQWWYDNGQIKDSGKYENGVQNGVFVHYHDNGNLKFRRQVLNSKNIGDIIVYHPNGQIHAKGFNDSLGRPQGRSLNYYSNGIIKVDRNFVDGLEEGEFIEYYENGNVKIYGNNEKGIKVGEWVEYDKNGKIISINSSKTNANTK